MPRTSVGLHHLRPEESVRTMFHSNMGDFDFSLAKNYFKNAEQA